jgi:hypothetical protein
MLDGWQVVQPLFNQQSNDTIRVEYEVCSFCVPVSDHAEASSQLVSHPEEVKRSGTRYAREQRYELRRLREDMHIVMRDLSRDCCSRLLCCWAVIRSYGFNFGSGHVVTGGKDMLCAACRKARSRSDKWKRRN